MQHRNNTAPGGPVTPSPAKAREAAGHGAVRADGAPAAEVPNWRRRWHNAGNAFDDVEMSTHIEAMPEASKSPAAPRRLPRREPSWGDYSLAAKAPATPTAGSGGCATTKKADRTASPPRRTSAVAATARRPDVFAPIRCCAGNIAERNAACRERGCARAHAPPQLGAVYVA